MKSIHDELPEAWREALEGDPGAELELASRLPELLMGDGAAAAGAGVEAASASEVRARLLRTVGEPPLRYAPFFGRVAELWDLGEEQVSGIFAELKHPSAWQRTPLPGVRVLNVPGGPRTAGGETFLVRFAPGLRFPRHRHPGPEKLLVLEGSYTDDGCQRIGPGDLHAMEPGSEHGFRVGKGEPCIGAALQYGREFTGPFMRIIAALFDRK